MTLIIALVIGLATTLAAVRYAQNVEDTGIAQRLAQQTNMVRLAIFNRFNANQQILLGAAGLFAASDQVSRDEWRRYVTSLSVEQRYPGILGIGYAEALTLDTLDAHVARVRAEGYQDYFVYPTVSTTPPSAIVFLEPFNETNRRAFGYNMYSEPIRRAAMMRARDTGQPALSGRVTLIQDIAGPSQAGVLLYVPVYRHGMPVGTIDERRAALLGWVYSPIRIAELMRGVFGDHAPNDSLRLFDRTARDNDMVPLTEGLPSNPTGGRSTPQTRTNISLPVAGREWIAVVSIDTAADTADISKPMLILVGGLSLTLLVVALILSLGSSEMRAMALAREMTAALRTEEERQRAILQNTADGIVTIDGHGILKSFNAAAQTMFGYRADEVIGRNVSMLMPMRFRADHDGHVAAIELNPQRRKLGMRREVVGLRRNGEEFPVWLAISKLPTREGQEYVGMVSDISEQKKALQAIEHMAHHDALTGLPNRARIQDHLRLAMKRAEREQRALAVMLLDLDHFKRINDSLGHHVGDEMLLAVTQRLRQALRETDAVARMGGDEFVILLPDVSGVDDATRLAATLMESLGKPLRLEGHDLVVSASLGICMYPTHGHTPEEVLKFADTAMYRAKDAGRGQYRFFETQMLGLNQRRLETEVALRKAISRKELSLSFQPQVDLDSGMLTGCEALLRWNHPVLGQVSPQHFIPLAEEIGLIERMGEWVLHEACQQTRAMQDQLQHPALRVAVNISPRQLMRGDLRKTLEHALQGSGLAASCLEIEITEGMLLENGERTLAKLHEIRSMGIQVAIDDFGTGYSNLAYIKRFPIDKLKIDRSFVRDIHLDANDAAVVSAIIVMAHTLHLDVIAEGVETTEQLRFLIDRHCGMAQGYLFGAPMPMDTFVRHAREHLQWNTAGRVRPAA